MGGVVFAPFCGELETGSQPDWQYGLGLAGGVSLSLYLFSLRILLGFLFLLFRDPGLSGSGPLPLGICCEPLPLLLHPTLGLP